MDELAEINEAYRLLRINHELRPGVPEEEALLRKNIQRLTEILARLKKANGQSHLKLVVSK